MCIFENLKMDHVRARRKKFTAKESHVTSREIFILMDLGGTAVKTFIAWETPLMLHLNQLSE